MLRYGSNSTGFWTVDTTAVSMAAGGSESTVVGVEASLSETCALNGVVEEAIRDTEGDAGRVSNACLLV